MRGPAPKLHLVRHGQTAWSATGRHTGATDLPLTQAGEAEARALAADLGTLAIDHVRCSPLERARRTCALSWSGASPIMDPDLVEWNYGDLEGRTTAEIRTGHPGWNLFRDGCPHGESLPDISARADRVLARLRDLGTCLVFSSGHFLRVLTARWLGLDAASGRLLALGTGSLSALGYEHDAEDPVILSWNRRHP